MRVFVCLVTALCLFACGQTATEQPVKQQESKYKHLLTEFKNKDFDTLHVISSADSGREYLGVALDSLQNTLLPQDIAQQDFNEPPSVFAVYKFPIGHNQFGLIARTPSEYESSSIKMLFFDQEKDSITSYIELADFWGDAGYSNVKDAWLYKEKGDGLRVLVRIQETQDNSVDSDTDTTVQEKTSYYLLDLSKKKSDTLSKDEKLGERFGHLFRE
jgi:hypothetical protein